ncbi:hypothetical protein QN219_25515 [Sinorhizobium sp. 7-81]|uniref:hypothetical protein n=1 Tax=Sinorhizobium sp. 8-89 TaxID=3049089 RepID=UPI0024C428D8|nr:hypothetical protein [Sinorhizobium sp. 8-89]MDK1493366.1 hypothetical protein [Sinorhizobium sp. 8-89]
MTYLDEDAERAIQLFMAEYAVSRDEALRRIVQDWLIGHGYLPDSEDNSVTGAADEAMLGGA